MIQAHNRITLVLALLLTCGVACRPRHRAGALDGPDDASETLDAGPRPQQSAACASEGGLYGVGTTDGTLQHAGSTRTFRVHVPPGTAGGGPLPLVLMFHGGGGSGRQLEENSANMDAIADRERFITVYPDGSGTIKTWNAGGCCGYAVEHDVDDVGFVAALLDHLQRTLCIDSGRIHAAGMSNGAMMSQRIGCELSERIAAIASVAGTNMTTPCKPARPLSVLEIHGSADGHVPWNGGEGCGPAGVAFTPVADSMNAWRTNARCGPDTELYYEQADGHCVAYDGCAANSDVVLCSIEGAGHSWPGGAPAAGLVPCPDNGAQSRDFDASELIWRFFAEHPLVH